MSGFGGALDGPSGWGMIAALYPPEERGTPIGMLTGIRSFAPSLGILLGGLLIEYVSWRYLFWGPALPVALALCAAPFVLRDVTHEAKVAKLRRSSILRPSS